MTSPTPVVKMAGFHKALLLGVFGFLPLWVAIVVLVLGGWGRPETDAYWTVAPWMVVAAVPLSGITLLIAFATMAVFNRASGDGPRKLRSALASLLGFVALAAVGAGLIWLNYQRNERRSRSETAAALEFVKTNPEVIRAAGPVRDAAVSSRTLASDPRFSITVRGDRWIYAIVHSEKGRLKLVCLSGQMVSEARKGDCTIFFTAIGDPNRGGSL